MAKVFIEESTLKGICDAIRAKKETTDLIPVTNIAAEIEGITGGSVDTDLVKYVHFMSEDGTTELFAMPVLNGDDCKDPIEHGDIETPTKESTEAYNYSYSGWAMVSGDPAVASPLANITKDKTVYAAFEESARYYTANFYDGDTLMQTSQVAYGTEATPPNTVKEGYAFVAWTPSDLTITGDTDFVGTWEVDQGWLVMMETPETLPTASAYNDVVYSVDGTRLFVASGTNIYMYDATTLPYILLKTVSVGYNVGEMCVSPDGQYLVICNRNYSGMYLAYAIYIYKITSTALSKVSMFSTSLAPISENGISPYCCKFNHAGTKLYIGGTIAIYIIDTSESTWTYEKYISQKAIVLDISPDDTKLFVGVSGTGLNRPYYVLDVENDYEDVSETYVGTSNSAGFASGGQHHKAIAYSPDGRYIACAFYESYYQSNALVIYDTSTTPYTKAFIVDKTDYSSFYTVTFNPSGTLLVATCANSPYIKAYVVGTWTEKDAPYTLPDGYGYNSAFNNDGTEFTMVKYSEPNIITYKVKE